METAKQKFKPKLGYSRDDSNVIDLSEVRRKSRRSDGKRMIKLRDYIVFRTTREMNRDNAVIQYGGQVLIVTKTYDHKGDLELLYRKPADVKIWYSNRQVKVPKVTAGGKVSGVEEKNPVDIWLYNRDRRSLRGVVNAPGRVLGPDWMNLWTGWGTVPATVVALDNEGKPLLDAKGQPRLVPDFSGKGCQRIVDHLFEVICDSNDGAFSWVLAWLADIVQNPLHKKPTGLMIYGPQGAGKSIIHEQILSRILGPKAYAIQRDTKFLSEDPGNATAAGNLLIAAEEAIFAGDPRAAAALKTFISQEKVGVRALYKDKIIVDNTARLLATVNPQAAGGHVVNMENDDRRWTILACATHRCRDLTYFDALMREIEGGGVEAFHAFLLNPKLLEGVDLRLGFETEAGIEQKVLSLPHQEAFIYECLQSRTFQLTFAGEQRQEWFSESKVDQADLFKSYLDWCKSHKRDYPGTIRAFNDKLRACLGLDKDRDVGRYNNNSRYWKMASLDGARRQFQTWIRCPDDERYLSKLWDDYGLFEDDRRRMEDAEAEFHAQEAKKVALTDEDLDRDIPF